MIDKASDTATSEDLPFTMQDRELLCGCLSGKTSFEGMVDQMIEKNRIFQ
ncbi:MAG TPA: hypothetical protein VHP54_00850 [Caproiciproducens sp.]|nr:hypothetical protein [Caproiciproducens sp.]